MPSILTDCVRTWDMYWGDGKALIPFLLGAGYLVVFRRKEKTVRELILVSVLFAAVFFCPVSAAVIWRFIGADVYWRMLWALPVIPLTACAAAHLLGTVRSGKGRLAVFALLAVMICVTGKEFLTENFIFVHNYQQVPDAAAAACNMINEDRGDRQIVAAGDDVMAAWIRVYDPTILMPYGRACRGAASAAARDLYDCMQDTPDCDYARLAECADALRCDYLLIRRISEEGEAYMNMAGYDRIGKVEDYAVMKKTGDF